MVPLVFRYGKGIGEREGSTYRPVVPKLCSADPKWSSTISHRFHRYAAAIAVWKFTHFLIKEYFFKKNCGTSLIGELFVSYDRYNIQLTNTLYTRSQRQSVIKVKISNGLLRMLFVAPNVSSEI